MLGGLGDRQALTAFLPAPGQDLAAPAGSHPGPKAVFIDAPPVARAVGRFPHDDEPSNEPGKLPTPGGLGQG